MVNGHGKIPRLEQTGLVFPGLDLYTLAYIALHMLNMGWEALI